MTNEAAQPFRFEFVAPSEDLGDFVNTLFLLRTGAGRIEEVLPAYSAQMLVFLEGDATIRFSNGMQNPPGRVFIGAPIMHAVPFELEGPVCAVGLSFTHLGWARFARRPADELHDTLIDPRDLFNDATAKDLEALADTDPAEMRSLVEPLENLLRAQSRPLRPLHEKMIAETIDWLSSAFSPPVEELYERLPLSERQVQRLCKRYFGEPPTRLLKRFRAVRAASLLAQENLSKDMRDEVYSAYFDQSHLINDIRRYTGRTPKLLVDGPLVADTLDPVGHGPAAKPLRERLKFD